jgi:hypothetical protein
MESWQKDLFAIIEVVAQEAEQLFCEFIEAVEEVAAEIDQALTDTLEPVLEIFLELDETMDEVTQSIGQRGYPVLQEHPACVGCCHYHGEIYGGNLLVCGMHPYGYESDTCPDWQSTWQDPNIDAD